VRPKIVLDGCGLLFFLSFSDKSHMAVAFYPDVFVILTVPVFCAAAYYLICVKRLFRRSAKAAAPSEPPAFVAGCRPVVVLHGSLLRWNALLETGAPDVAVENTVEAINDFLTAACRWVVKTGGLFERTEGASFYGFWGTADVEGSAIDGVRSALRCALALRQDLAAINESRKIDGLPPLWIGMGVHAGRGLVARIGAAGAIAPAIVGEVNACAAFLDRQSALEGVDLLVSQDVWESASAEFLGQRRGETAFTELTGLTAYHVIKGYREAEGKDVIVETPYCVLEIPSVAKSVERWLINNGTQIVGPYSAGEIAGRLFAQEIDFDAECWREGTGQSSRLAEAGIFTGSAGENATLWVYDGALVHGPFSKGFLQTAVARGAIGADSHVCTGTTVDGWITLRSWAEENGVSDIWDYQPESKKAA